MEIRGSIMMFKLPKMMAAASIDAPLAPQPLYIWPIPGIIRDSILATIEYFFMNGLFADDLRNAKFKSFNESGNKKRFTWSFPYQIIHYPSWIFLVRFRVKCAFPGKTVPCFFSRPSFAYAVPYAAFVGRFRFSYVREMGTLMNGPEHRAISGSLKKLSTSNASAIVGNCFTLNG